ncbi:MAG: RNA polymerase sigma factor [Gammaproteobacteria bacterium]|jgi:RNA polymerase sigma-70 factor (ECF subfamily)
MLIDKDKFTKWIDEQHTSLFKHAFWMTGNRALAEDLVQETFYQAWKSRHDIENEDNPLPWLLTVLRRQVYKEYQQTRLDTLALSEQHIDVHIGGSDNSTEVNLDTLLDLGTGLMSLSTRQRELMLLHGLHGFTYDQIAEQLGIPIGTVMSRISRARQALRAFYTNSESDKVIVPFRKRN